MAIELTEMIIIGQMMVLLGVIVVQGLLKQLQHAQNIWKQTVLIQYETELDQVRISSSWMVKEIKY